MYSLPPSRLVNFLADFLKNIVDTTNAINSYEFILLIIIIGYGCSLIIVFLYPSSN